MAKELDPVKYEVFLQRMRSILEEGRVALSMVIGSPAIVEGGEMMTSFYDGDGSGVLTAQGTLFHVLGSSDAIFKTIEWYGEDPGIKDGDQFFWGDPYIAGTHLMDQIMVKPIFWNGSRVAWVGTMTHSAEVGGIPRGLSTEIFHEGVRVHGLKVVEGGKLRIDNIRNIVDQVRDPDVVGLDIMGRIASNNVIEKGFMGLTQKFGIDFVAAAMKKLREDSDKAVRLRLKSMPDGTWRQRVYWSNTVNVDGKEKVHPFKVQCTMTKKGEELLFDFTGTSPQNQDYRNATLCAAKSQLWIALAAFMFWDIPWNAGMTEMVKYNFPEGTVLNCRYPASCGLATLAGGLATDTGMGCIARMMYAAGKNEYVNSSWNDVDGGGIKYWYYGTSQWGGPVGIAIYDLFASGQGASPTRDGNDTGGVFINSRAAISDVEWKETYWPFLYLAQKHCTDSGGYGKFRGGMTMECIQMVYGTRDLSCDYLPVPRGGEVRAWGLFGGYPTGNSVGAHLLLKTDAQNIKQRLSQGTYPVKYDELGPPWGIEEKKSPKFRIERTLGGIRVNVDEYDIICYQYAQGGGYGDPLDRDPQRVLQDVKSEAIYFETASRVYGVVINPGTLEIDVEETDKRRQEIIEERLSKAERLKPAKEAKKTSSKSTQPAQKTLMRIHEYLGIIEKNNGEKVISCIKCGNEFCAPGDNYKKYALRWTKPVCEMKRCLDKEIMTYYQEYICPGCGTLLQVDTWCPELDSDEPLWDIDIKV